MTTERLENIKRNLGDEMLSQPRFITGNDCLDLYTLIDAEIAAQSVTDGDVMAAIEWFEENKKKIQDDLDYRQACHMSYLRQMPNEVKRYTLVITALRQMRGI